jgi:hypothetical protein
MKWFSGASGERIDDEPKSRFEDGRWGLRANRTVRVSKGAKFDFHVQKTLYGIEHYHCRTLSCPMTDRHFRELQDDLEEAVSELKRTDEPQRRRDPLLEMRLLLVEADRLLLDRSE